VRDVFRATIAVALALVAACKFDPRLGEGPDAPGGGSQMPDGSTMGGDGTTSGRAPCATTDPTGLVACFEFEDGMGDGVLDDSSAAHRDATTAGVTSAMRGNSHALQVLPTAVTRVAQTSALDLGAGYTFSVWVHPDTLPDVGAVYGILDHELEYAMLIGNTLGTLQNRCVHTGVARTEFTQQLPVNTWSFLACTWDGSNFCAYRWTTAGDHEHFCHHPTIPPAASGTQGLAIGHLSDNGAAHSRFDGALDSLQLYSRGMTEDQLCAQVGQGAGCMPCNTCE
jgi:concanavalin A-like lectin/glucanase superfamily protein